MAKVRNTKTELKAQTDSLKRFERFLPMLQLKKQQLQLEIALINNRIQTLDKQIEELRQNSENWIALFSLPGTPENLTVLKNITTETGNIAGVAIPIFVSIEVEHADLDLFITSSWLDDAQDLIEKRLGLLAEITTLEEQRRLIQDELTTTSQRVNLFEKVKIPECRENIRVIRIHLGDEQTAAVARGKLAKRQSDSRQTREAVA